MSDYKPGDRVRIVHTIEEATVADIGEHRGERYIFVKYPGGAMTFCPDRDIYTVTRLAPTPQAGQVWQHPEHGEMHILTGMSGRIAHAAHEALVFAVEELDWTGGRCVYPAAGAENGANT